MRLAVLRWSMLFAVVAVLCLAVGTSVAGAQESFGISAFSSTPSTLQAGAHADFTTFFSMNDDSTGKPVDQVKDVQFDLPPGLVGNPRAIPRCSSLEFSMFACMPSTQVGVLKPTFIAFGGGPASITLPVFNLTPESSAQVATFGASFLFITIIVQVDLRNDGTAGLTATISDLSTILPLQSSELTLWGVPADSSHEAQRTNQLLSSGPQPAGVPPAAFMTNPTDCTDGPLTSVARADSWQHPGQFVSKTVSEPAPIGCQRLRIAPSLEVTPDTTQADAPAGYTIDLRSRLEEDPYGLATPALRAVSIALPQGTSLSPSVANGLEACSDTQFEDESCPNAAKLGAVSITSPTLPDQLTGPIYLGAPEPGEMFRIFLTASADGVVIKLVGRLRPDPATGQLLAVFDQTPQQPFSDLRVSFFGGPFAALANPAGCGVATSTSRIISYSGQLATPASSFVVDADGRGGACSASPAFVPGFSAGTISPAAGAFSPFALTVSRADGQQDLSTIAAELPAGLFAMLARVPQCAEAEVAQSACSTASRVGSVTVGVGAGAAPFYLSGSVYLTGPYRGAPFGLAIVVPAIAGPFDLGTILIRAGLRVNPSDLRVGIDSDPLPQIIDGIPLRIRTVNITVDRSGFILNPSGCAPQQVTGTIGSSGGLQAAVSTPFQVGGCSGLPLAPKLTASTQAKAASTGAGASLDLSVGEAEGAQTNVRSVTVQLPARLRPRLTTIQQACKAPIFFANAAACPPESLVGTVTIGTPALAAPLTGPIYLVFRGGTAYPDLMMAPQGSGLRVELDGALAISNRGIVSAAFRALPDVPISSFRVELPRGPHSMLGATGSVCSTKLNIPFTIVGQNEARLTGSTRITVTGCPKHPLRKAPARGRKAASRRP